MSVDFSSADIQAAVDTFHAQTIEWLVLGYSVQRDKLILLASGSDLDACRAAFDAVAEDVAYGFVRDGHKTGVVTYLGEGVGGVKRARATVHGRLLSSNLFTPNGGSLTITSSAELTSDRLQSNLVVPAPSPSGSPSPPTHQQQQRVSPSPSSSSAPSTAKPLPNHADAGGQGSISRPRTPEPSTPTISATSPSPSQTTRNVYTPPVGRPHEGGGFTVQQQQTLTAYSPAAAREAGPSVNYGSAPYDSVQSSLPSHGQSSSSAGSYPARDASSPLPSKKDVDRASPNGDASSNPISRLAQLESSRASSSASPPASPAMPSHRQDGAPPPRSPGGIGRPSIPLFSSLSLSARRPPSNTANGDGSATKGRISSFGSLRERFSSRTKAGAGKSGVAQSDEADPPALPPKDAPAAPLGSAPIQQAQNESLSVRTAELVPIGVDNGPSFASSMMMDGPSSPESTMTGIGRARSNTASSRNWEAAYDDGYGYSLSPPRAALGPASPPQAASGADPLLLGKVLAPPSTSTSTGSLAAIAADEPANGDLQRRVSSSTFGRPGREPQPVMFDSAGSPPMPAHATSLTSPDHASNTSSPLSATAISASGIVPESGSSRGMPTINGQPPIDRPVAPRESVLHRKRPSLPGVGLEEPQASAHWLQLREEDRREDDNALLPDSVTSRRAAQTTVDPWEALDARRAEREAVRLRVEAEARERKRLRELAAEREAAERVAREEERLRAARERTREVERERAEKEERERREREQVEEAKRLREQAREGSAPPANAGPGGRLADGWLTVQAPNTVIFRRRWFHILPSEIRLYKDSNSTDKPVATISLPSTAAPDFSDAYEETQVLHSFGIPDTAGDVWLAYLDSESDKELVIAAMTVASQ